MEFVPHLPCFNASTLDRFSVKLRLTRIRLPALAALAALAAAAALLAFAILWSAVLRSAATPRIAIGIVSYRFWDGRAPQIPFRLGTPSTGFRTLQFEPISYDQEGRNISVRVGITNTGHVALRYNRINFDANARLRVESQTGWTNRDIGPFALMPYLSAVLKPSERTEAIILLPGGTLHWQVTYKTRAASFRQRVVASLPSNWFPRLYPLCKRFLSDREGPEREMSSAVFECPQHEPVALPDWTPPPFGSDPPWPAPP